MVSEIKNELTEISRSQKKETKIKLALNQNKINIQSKNISLTAIFNTVKLQYRDRKDTNCYNILTARLFKYIYLLFQHITFYLLMLKK